MTERSKSHENHETAQESDEFIEPDGTDTAEDGKFPIAEDAGDTETGPEEKGGPKGPEPTRYGDWEKNGIVSDF